MTATIDRTERNPFLRYRALLDSYDNALQAGWSDADFVSLVRRLDSAIAEVDGHGFAVTPLTREPGVAAAIELPTPNMWIKNDTGNVGGSQKARHLFGVALHQAIETAETDTELAIASCGNAALAAAVVAKAEQRPLRVFIPTWAEPSIVKRLQSLDARIEVCERRPGEVGDPTFLRFLEAVDEGATPFSVQGTVTPSTIDGGRTLGWELSEQLGDEGVTGPLKVMLQVGGGAMAYAVSQGIEDARDEGWLDVKPTYHPVQTEACAPFERAYELLVALTPLVGSTVAAAAAELSEDDDAIDSLLFAALQNPDSFMWPWELVGESAADGILDDMTYDWLGVMAYVLRSGGWPVVATEADVHEAHRAVIYGTDIHASHTGTAGVAGLLRPDMTAEIDASDSVLCLVTGAAR